MNIQQAKEEIRKTIKTYLQKDEYGEYRIPIMKQRPIFMIGAPGIGKTAIMAQIASELDIGLVSYSMTHHTRQSAIGLPYIASHDYDGTPTRVSEYTMSEILASVYNSIETDGKREGILFLDEINCVSETLAPAILQFLQYKTFGGHTLPLGWIIVSAGNPPQYNKSVKEFDIATRDRLRYLIVEEDYDCWKQYARDHRVHGAILAFLEVNRKWFYSIRTTTDGPAVATARGWEDLSFVIQLYEELDYKADTVLVIQFITDTEIATRFAAFYELYRKYRENYQLKSILEGNVSEEVLKRARDSRFDERVSVLEMLNDEITAELSALEETENALKRVAKLLRIIKKEKGKDAIKLLDEQILSDSEELKALKKRKLADTAPLRELQRALQYTRHYRGMVSEGEAGGKGNSVGERNSVAEEESNEEDKKGFTKIFSRIKKDFDKKAQALAKDTDRARDMLENVFNFVSESFGTGQEMVYLITILTANRYSSAFIAEHGCDSYYQYNKDLLLYDVAEDLRKEIAEELLI